MMLKFDIQKRLSDSQIREWDTFIRNCFNPAPFAYHAYSACLKNVGAPIFLKWVDSNGAFMAIALMLKKGIFVRRAFEGNPAYGWGLAMAEWSEELLRTILSDLLSWGKKLGIGWLTIRPYLWDEYSDAADTILQDMKFISSNRQITGWVNLTLSPEELLRSFRENHRRNIKKAISKGVEIVSGTDSDIWLQFYSVWRDMWQQKGIKLSWQRTEFLQFTSHYQEYLRCFSALSEEGLVAGLGLLTDGVRIARYLWGANAPSTIATGHLLHYEAMLWAREQGYQWYDMGGIPVGNPELKGIEIFKRGFRGKEVRILGEYIFVFKPWMWNMYQWIKRRR